MKNPIPCLLALIISVSSASCIRDQLPECPPMRIELAVRDKNYSNIDDVELAQRRSEDLPFRQYVGTLCWTLRDFKTGKIVDEAKIHAVDDDSRELSLTFPNTLPYGKYVLTVWGNLEDEGPLGDDPSTIDFHPEGKPGADVYMTCDTLTYEYGIDFHRVELERTKGKLLVQKINIPLRFSISEKRISGIFSGMDSRFSYSGETSVSVGVPLPGDPEVLTETLLSPSSRSEGSILSLSLRETTRSGETSFDPADIRITMERNKLTVVRYVWDDTTDDMSIYVLVNADWQELVKLEFDD